jgi:hypothetical protein
VIAPSNDLFANAKIVGRLNYFDTLTINDSTTTNLDNSDPFPDTTGCVLAAGDGRYHSVWYRYTPAQPGTVLIETTGSDYDTVVSVWTGSPGALSEMGCADDIVPGTQRQSRLQFDANAGTTYNVMVAGYYPEEQGTLQFSMYGPASSTPPVVNVSPSPLNFAPRAVGTVSAAQTLTFTFPNGTVNKIAANITGDYSFSTTCNVIQSQLSSCTADIVFAPIAPGARNGTFTITSDASNSPLNVPLSGTASAASVTLTPANGQFIGVVGSPTLAQAFTFSNNSGAPIIVSNVSTSGDFGKNSNCANVPNGGSCNISVTMIASQVGSRIGSLTVTHNGPGGSTAVNLAGTGVDFNLGLARPTRSHRPPGPIAIRAGQRKNVDVVLSSTVPIEQDVVLQCTAPKGLTCALSDSLTTLRSGQTAISANIRVVPSRRLPTQLSRTIVVSITAQAGQVSRTLEIPVLLVNSPLRLR